MEKKIKKLSLKKVTILNFEEASRILGGTGETNCPFTTEAANCSSNPGRGPVGCVESY
jgi:hypothetical protein